MQYKSFALVWALQVLVTAAQAQSDCKCTPADDCWPSPPTWSALNQTIEGRLIKAVPPASVCYPSESNYDQDACNTIISKWGTTAFHAADPISVDTPANANDSCNPIYPNGTSLSGDPLAGQKGCTIGYYPLYVINASDFSHVQKGVKFALRHNLRLNIKNTGHGRSATENSLSIWTHHLKGSTFSEHFEAQGCPANGTNGTSQQWAITTGAGAQDQEMFEFAAEHNALVVGGTDTTVGLVGWLTGGGHGYATGTYGLGADNVLEVEMVTPEGKFITANACQNSDLFWAIRGGGGGSFGVITQLTMKAYPMPTTHMWSFVLSPKNGTGVSQWYDEVAYAFSQLPYLKDAGLQGYQTVSGAPFTFSYAMFGYDMPNGTIEELIKPIKAKFDTQNSSVTYTSTVIYIPTFIDMFHMFNLTEGAAGDPGISGSRLLPARALTEDIDFLARTLEKIGPKAVAPAGPLSNPSLAGSVVSNSHLQDNALNPAWRDAVVHLIVKESWSDGLPADQVQAAIDDMTYNKGYALRQLAPDSGAYFNEANLNEPNWQWTLFGENYSRLRAIKQKYDPNGLQWCFRCVGSEDWEPTDDGNLCRKSWA